MKKVDYKTTEEIRAMWRTWLSENPDIPEGEIEDIVEKLELTRRFIAMLDELGVFEL